MNITYVLDGKHMQVHNNLSKDGFKSVLTLLNWLWEAKSVTYVISDIVEADMLAQIQIDSKYGSVGYNGISYQPRD